MSEPHVPDDVTEQAWREALVLATRASVVRRALRVAVVVGSVLVAINYGDRLLAGELDARDGIRILLTYCVPYCVSTYAAVGALMQARRAQRD
ncbi:MAG: nitrate/nitrite transporter NrtS [Gammaproteobacteria bacterium]